MSRTSASGRASSSASREHSWRLVTARLLHCSSPLFQRCSHARSATACLHSAQDPAGAGRQETEQTTQLHCFRRVSVTNVRPGLGDAACGRGRETATASHGVSPRQQGIARHSKAVLMSVFSAGRRPPCSSYLLQFTRAFGVKGKMASERVRAARHA